MTARSGGVPSLLLGFLLGLLLCSALACAVGRPREAGVERVEPVRISQLLDEGDAARRASLRLIVEGLDADTLGERARARASYERSIQVDATNPYAYLAIARHHVDGARPEQALRFLDQATSLLEMQVEDSPRIQVHLIGLRGEALYASGRIDEGIDYLEQARQMAPSVWGDGRLAPEELR
jgi:tetratricopeptide (TPR) repeat protein